MKFSIVTLTIVYFLCFPFDISMAMVNEAQSQGSFRAPEVNGAIRVPNNVPNSPDPSQGMSEPTTSESSALEMHFRRVRDAEIVEHQYAVDQEEERATANVRELDPGNAASWLAGFISTKPLSCPVKERTEWVDAIPYAVQKNGLPLCKEILGLTASIISIESSFRADPAVADSSKAETISGQLERAEKEFSQKYGTWLVIPPFLNCINDTRTNIILNFYNVELKERLKL